MAVESERERAGVILELQRGASPAAAPASTHDGPDGGNGRQSNGHGDGHTNGHAGAGVALPTKLPRTHDGLVPVGPGRPRRRTAKTQLLIIDEHPLIRAGVRRLVESQSGVQVAEATSVDHAITLARGRAPDVVLMDIDDASDASIEDMRRLRDALGADTAVVVVARRHDDESIYRAVVGGAAGIVGEHAPPAELVETIREAALGNEPISQILADRPPIARRVLETYAVLRSRSAVDDPQLTQRELTILGLAAEGKTNHQIGMLIGVSEHTVKSAISNVLARLGLKHRTEAVVHAVRSGWINPATGHEKAAVGVADSRSFRDFA